ncbi:hypothetical protein [Streptomyces sp. NPDC058612]|uniref:hypothetical protein n=1 Tax=Streptomyces sp. NPDC058612 TaxID=3346555 RepID=UPI00364B1807
MSGRALSFGSMAHGYERFRPGYPMELFDMVMAYAGVSRFGLPSRWALGQARRDGSPLQQVAYERVFTGPPGRRRHSAHC